MSRARPPICTGSEAPAGVPLARSTTAILEGWQRCVAAARGLGAIGNCALPLRPAAPAAEAQP